MSALRELTDRWKACGACKLRRSCRQVVVGEPWSRGDVSGAPVLLVIGEAPGRNEDETGRPFVGEAGQILRREILEPADVRLAYITNAVACRPPGNRDPEPEELEACTSRLAELAEVLRPAGILFVGRVAEEACAGRPWLAGIPSVGIIHPAALLYRGWPSESTRKTLGAQLAKVRRLLVRAGRAAAPAEVTPKKRGKKAASGSPGGAEGHAHSYAPAGAWTRPGEAEEAFRACSSCADLEGKTARSPSEVAPA